PDLFGSVNELFGNALDKDELEKIEDYYSHHDGWTNRLIQGDSHLVMASLLEREGMAGQVQMIYIDPPYGIKYGSNWQIKLNNRDVKDGADEALTGEPEVIKAFRDTWELGIHSYLSYIRDRLLIVKELLTESGSCFVQISDENVHLVRSVMDEVFGSENFVSEIIFRKTSNLTADFIPTNSDYILWYSKNREQLKRKYKQLYIEKTYSSVSSDTFGCVELDEDNWRRLTKEEKDAPSALANSYRLFGLGDLTSSHEYIRDSVEFKGKHYTPKNRYWSTSVNGLKNLISKNRIASVGDTLRFKRYFDDFPVTVLGNVWNDTGSGSQTENREYVVQTTTKVIQRCMLMTTDPGDLVLDPTCGSGTTAFVAEQFGRRWITIDTSRIALNIAKTRLMTATFPYYKLYSEQESRESGNPQSAISNPQSQDIRQGFKYKTVPHITLKSLANDEPPATETLYDKPEIDNKRLRVCGAFIVETLQNFEPVAPEDLDDDTRTNEQEGAFEEVIRQHLLSTGVKNGRKDEQVSFTRVELLSHAHLHAEGFYQNGTGEKKAYFYIGAKFGTVSKTAVNEAIKECRTRGDANWLVILGFSFESDIQGSQQTTSFGTFEVTKARIHDDLLQEGLKKKPAKSAASFVTIGEPDVIVHKDGNAVTLEIQGLDIYDPIKDEVKARDLHDIAYWMVDDNYDGSSFLVNQVFFCGGDKDEFNKWKKGLSDLSKQNTRVRAEKTLKIQIDDEAFDRIYGFRSHPIEIKKAGQKIAVRIIIPITDSKYAIMWK
ncbi:MAG: site-specific DNA-methyltransferase, partial [Acidobacteriota bacterium]|nr:site-specific DNA-methyltransferase [Acidobacteriota bacterium]